MSPPLPPQSSIGAGLGGFGTLPPQSSTGGGFPHPSSGFGGFAIGGPVVGLGGSPPIRVGEKLGAKVGESLLQGYKMRK